MDRSSAVVSATHRSGAAATARYWSLRLLYFAAVQPEPNKPCQKTHRPASIAAMTNGATVSLADDQILSNQILRGIKILRDHLGCSLHEALDAFAARYEVLRVERPEAFACGHDEYWAGFYS